jgi:hypothetical protein
MPIIVRAFPLSRPLEEVRGFTTVLGGERRAELDAFYRSYGISHESWHLQETPSGPWVIVVTSGDIPEDAVSRYALASDGFEAWFKSQVGQLTGIDLNAAPLGPPTTSIFAWSDQEKPT